jgi:hypothetical protein
MSAQRLLQVKQSSINMMRKRGYTSLLTDEEDDKLLDSSDDYLLKAATYFQYGNTPLRELLIIENETSLRTMLSTVYVRKMADGKLDKCLVFFVETEGKKVLVREIRLVTQIMLNHKIQANRAIIISHEEIGSTAITGLKVLDTKNPIHIIQHFQDSELLYDPFDHVYSPISVEELDYDKVEKLKEKIISIHALPTIFSSDPIVKRMGFLVDTVLKLERPILVRGNLLDTEISYSLVISPANLEKKLKKKI